MTKILLLNGPARSGKDTAAKAIVDFIGSDLCGLMRFSAPLKEFIAEITGETIEELEKYKDEPLHASMATFRQCQIHLFNSMSEVFGTDWLGRIAYNRIQHSEYENFVFADCGRYDDLVHITRHYDPSDIQIIQVMREGYTFDNDIRTYVSAKGVRTRPIINKEIGHFKREVIDMALEFFGE